MSFPLYFDEHVDVELARLLRNRGFDVETAAEAGLAARGVPDEAHLAHAADAGRVLLTYDAATFPAAAALRLASGQTHPGVVLCRRRPLKELAGGSTPALRELPSLIASGPGFPGTRAAVAAAASARLGTARR